MVFSSLRESELKRGTLLKKLSVSRLWRLPALRPKKEDHIAADFWFMVISLFCRGIRREYRAGAACLAFTA
jgi:hypothetical protein